MYSSKKDWEGAWKIILIMFALGVASYLLGFEVHQIFTLIQIKILFETVTKFLLIPLGIDFVLVLIFKVL
jgi:vacuolar-type H+-ATPase subunit C/Vma6